MIDENLIPKHVAIIPDGNRRWAKENGLGVLEGHQYVAEEVFPRLIAHAIKRQIPYLTFWVFSRENWQRSQEEVSGLMALFKRLGMSKLVTEAGKMNARVKIIGRKDDFDADLAESLRQAEEKTKNNNAIVVTIALSYSGRDEIVRAVEKIKERVLQQPDLMITEALIGRYLDTAHDPLTPDPDFIIRTSGEQRLSGFMPWQGTYSELYFTEAKMPEFDEAAFDLALADYASRQRRFGQ